MPMKLLFFTMFYLFSLKTMANESIINICSPNSNLHKKVIKSINFLAANTDKLNHDIKCTQIKTTVLKENLFRKFLTKKHSFITFTNFTETNKEHCKLKLLDQSLDNKDQLRVQVNHKKFAPHANSKSAQTINEMSLYFLEETENSVTIADQKISIYCERKNTGYKLKLSSESETLNLQNQVFIPFGAIVEIAHFKQNKNDQDNSASIGYGKLINNQANKWRKISLKAD